MNPCIRADSAQPRLVSASLVPSRTPLVLSASAVCLGTRLGKGVAWYVASLSTSKLWNAGNEIVSCPDPASGLSRSQTPQPDTLTSRGN